MRVTCPAAAAIAGVVESAGGVVCGVMLRDHQVDDGLDMTAGRSGFIQHEASGGIYLSLQSDPSSVRGFCCGDAMPVLFEDAPAVASYTACPVWQAERRRLREGRDALAPDVEPEAVSMGVADPWAQAGSLDDLFGGVE